MVKINTIKMTPIQFKEKWNQYSIEEWSEFTKDELDKTKLTQETKEFLKVGFPSFAAPYLSFGLESYNNKFHTIANCYESGNDYNKYLIFGSDGAGNPICFDMSKNDKLVLLDHEENFEEIDYINTNIYELADCLLAYKNFIKRIQSENGDEAFLDSNYTIDQYTSLEESLKKANLNLLKESGFWRNELRTLKQGIKNR